LYKLELQIAKPVCLVACAGEVAWRWHAWFGHVNFNSLRKMASECLVLGLPTMEHVEQICEACLIRKHTRAPFPQQVTRHVGRILELFHGDLCGSINPATPSGNRYFLLLVDDYSHYMWISLMPANDGAATAIKRVQTAAKRKTGKLLAALRTDCGGEFSAANFNKYCAQLGANHERSAPYSPPAKWGG
jgi:hypothetical protein